MIALTVQQVTEADAHILRNLYPFYLYDLSAFDEHVARINNHGVYDDDDTRNHEAAGFALNHWWQRPASLHPFIFLHDERPVGFALIAAAPYCRDDVDHAMDDFFVLRPYRRRGLGRRAAAELFARFPGRWELTVLHTNRPALTFWRQVIDAHALADGRSRRAGPIRRWPNAPVGDRFRFRTGGVCPPHNLNPRTPCTS